LCSLLSLEVVERWLQGGAVPLPPVDLVLLDVQIVGAGDRGRPKPHFRQNVVVWRKEDVARNAQEFDQALPAASTAHRDNGDARKGSIGELPLDVLEAGGDAYRCLCGMS